LPGLNLSRVAASVESSFVHLGNMVSEPGFLEGPTLIDLLMGVACHDRHEGDGAEGCSPDERFEKHG
jgi:hypothetical protein